MTVRVGVIGAGMIGTEHIRRLTHVLNGAAVVAVTDVDPARAAEVAAGVPGARVLATGKDVIADDAVDAVVVTSWGPTHEEYVLASVAAGKPVFCEKPLATTREACRRILDAEEAAGRRFVMVGFMRRYDASYRALKAALAEGGLGAPLMVHCAHRNATVPSLYTSDMAINDTSVHEIDIVRWLLDEEIVAARVLRPRRNSRAAPHLVDPLVVMLEMAGGALVDVEVSVNIGYGYDIRCEVVAEGGTAALAEAGGVVVRSGGRWGGAVPADWRERFLRAYDVELQDWVDAVAGGTTTGPTAWDGYAATVVADACLEALRTGERVGVSLGERPALYGLVAS
ncbi:Gfo/Idh/MocA family oxidoreductase [Spirilliplanes yamanashiensis]|uniref:Inositol 2-dehydrogenase n=1 Tax=Spirilliplanes yamanashiensis TaxID=42233 RepID=A0A8J3YAR8_9ACTN|nr:Gfo/Idh/MocA family oxidoreductase [Spirilliplanes yamanashiensis]MDP9817587.1 myo-inositol 2-dehydrogenase/D-chiro-inositol 1-dehydrogenase [Spirilliplanes yamanashiensis]GIJ04397.1 inositol 2-dehydrogenase [Spirilliplanes yamanashiensis]